MEQRFILPFCSQDIFNGSIKKLCISECINRTISQFRNKWAFTNRCSIFLKRICLFEFVVAKISKTITHVCNEFESSIICWIKNIIGSWPDKNTKASNFLNVMVKAVLFDNRLGQKTCFVLKKGMFLAFLVV